MTNCSPPDSLSDAQQPVDVETVVRVMPKRKPSKEAIQEVKRRLSMKLTGQGDVSVYGEEVVSEGGGG